MATKGKSSSGKRKTPARKISKNTRNSKKTQIPAYKAIILCLGIIAVSMCLLLITDLKNPSVKAGNKSEESTSITRRYDEKSEKSSSEASGEIKRPEQKLTPPSKNSTSDKNAAKSASSSGTAAKSSPNVSTPSSTAKSASSSNSAASSSTAAASSKKTEASASTAETSSKTPASSSATASAAATAGTQKTTGNNTTGTYSAPKTTEKNSDTAQSQSSFNFPKAVNKAQLIFVFDDGGQNLSQLDKFLTLPFPITVAVLPQITHSVEAAEKVRKSGNELMLHQPMQSVNANVNPGPGAITPDMSEDQIIAQLFVNINQIGPIAGLNNHEGSAITADAEKMAIVMQMCSENGIFFLDSRTNVETKVPYVAKQLGYSYYERNIFLDNEKTRANVLTELNKGLALANKNGSVIMIGHIWSADFLPQILKEAYPELKEKGYTFSIVSKSNALKN